MLKLKTIDNIVDWFEKNVFNCLELMESLFFNEISKKNIQGGGSHDLFFISYFGLYSFYRHNYF